MSETVFQIDQDGGKTARATDPRETRPREQRVSEQFEALRKVLETAKTKAYYQKPLANIDPASVSTIADLEAIPVLRKDDLVGIQAAAPPFGGLMRGGQKADHLFVSPGPIHEPGFLNGGYWRIERAMRAANIVADDIIHNTFSYHLTPGAWLIEAGARDLGCSVIPAGNAPLEQQLLAISQYQANTYCGTPDFLKTLVEAYQQSGRGTIPIKKALVSGGALTNGLRDFFQASGIHTLQCYATAELGLIAYETGLSSYMIVDEDVIVEIIDPETGKAMPFGSVGEVVVTTLREDYPLIRFGTGDLSAFVHEPQADGRTGLVLLGWLGRSDQAVKVRGQFVRPSQIHAFCDKIEGLNRARLVVDRSNEKDELMLFCEFGADVKISDEIAMEKQLSEIFRALCHLRSDINIAPHGTVPDDGKVIVDMR